MIFFVTGIAEKLVAAVSGVFKRPFYEEAKHHGGIRTHTFFIPLFALQSLRSLFLNFRSGERLFSPTFTW